MVCADEQSGPAGYREFQNWYAVPHDAGILIEGVLQRRNIERALHTPERQVVYVEVPEDNCSNSQRFSCEKDSGRGTPRGASSIA